MQQWMEIDLFLKCQKKNVFLEIDKGKKTIIVTSLNIDVRSLMIRGRLVTEDQ